MHTEVIPAGRKGLIQRAVEVLRAGGLVAFPTDTVYGLAAVPTDRAAVARIYEVKGRNASRPISLLLSDTARLTEVAVVPEAVRPLMRRFWPGGLTLVFQKTTAVVDEVSIGPTIGVRIPDLPLACELIRTAGGVLAVTSANRSGELSPLTAAEVLEQLGGKIELLIDGGPCRGGVPSTVLDCTVWPPAVLRHGAVAEADIRAALDRAARQSPK